MSERERIIAEPSDCAITSLQYLSMLSEKRKNVRSILDRIITLLGIPWLEVAEKAWKIVRKLMQGRSVAGLYEVLEYESTLESIDQAGKCATFKKREKVRYLQDNVIAYQDQAWGDGEILL